MRVRHNTRDHLGLPARVVPSCIVGGAYDTRSFYETARTRVWITSVGLVLALATTTH